MSPHPDKALQTWVLPGLPANSTGGWLTLAAVTAMLLSRLLLLPDGPWEQDEALFAAGVLDFDVTRHRPHPPGFPGWIAIGKLLFPLVGDPVRALQVASSVASAVMFWALARLLDRLLPGGRATLLAAAFSMSPLVWVHAGRAFSTTPAVACAVLALLAWRGNAVVYGAGWVLLGLSALIRPQLLPELAVLGLAGLNAGSHSRRVRVTSVAVAAGLCLLCITGAFVGDTEAVTRAFVDHFGRHRGALSAPLIWANLGIVRGLGHPAVAAALAGLVVAGLWRATRTNRTHGVWLIGLLTVTAWMILRQHHPGYPRYAVVLLAAALPALAWGLDSLPRRLCVLLGVGLTLVGSVSALGPLLSMHTAPLPVVAAARLATLDSHAGALAYSHGVFSFARLEAEQGGLRILDVTERSAPPRRPANTYAIDGRTLHALEGVTVCTIDLPSAPARAMALGQGRFTTARLTRDAVFLGAGTFGPEFDEAGDRFSWLGPSATLALPADSERLHLRLHVPDDVQGAAFSVTAGDRVRRGSLQAGPMSVEVVIPQCVDGCEVVFSTAGNHFDENEFRPLTVQLDGAWVEGSAYAPAYGRWSPGHPRTVRARDVVLEGFEAPEVFAGEHRGAWTHARASASFPARPGTLRVRVARPEHTPGNVTVSTDVGAQTVDLGPKPTTLTLRTQAPGGRARLEFTSPTFVPAEVRAGSDDSRDLGLILYEVEFLPDDDSCRPDDVSSPLGKHAQP
ncbi:MAG: hypothetical protein ACRBN8_09890 [Nannocystales bacterium]